MAENECEHIYQHLDTKRGKEEEAGWHNWQRKITDRFFCTKCLHIEERESYEKI